MRDDAIYCEKINDKPYIAFWKHEQLRYSDSKKIRRLYVLSGVLAAALLLSLLLK